MLERKIIGSRLTCLLEITHSLIFHGPKIQKVNSILSFPQKINHENCPKIYKLNGPCIHSFNLQFRFFFFLLESTNMIDYSNSE